jgi:hypothetical protein
MMQQWLSVPGAVVKTLLHAVLRTVVVPRRSGILERCLKRLEWDRARAREAQELEDEAERERQAMQQVRYCASWMKTWRTVTVSVSRMAAAVQAGG